MAARRSFFGDAEIAVSRTERPQVIDAIPTCGRLRPEAACFATDLTERRPNPLDDSSSLNRTNTRAFPVTTLSTVRSPIDETLLPDQPGHRLRVFRARFYSGATRRRLGAALQRQGPRGL